MMFRSCGLALALCASSVSLHAQETVSTASVSGRVTDPHGAVVPGARVVARQTETNLTREAVTDEGGRFRLSYLRTGPYEFVVSFAGFADARRQLTLGVGSAFELAMTLSVANLDATVDVAADAVALEAARSQIAGTIAEAEVRDLPMNGRNFLDVALLVPGVSPTNVASTQTFAETSAVPGGGLSVGSQRNLSNNFIVDGLSANDDAAALSGIPYRVDAVEQFQVVTSGGQAELGRALGGYFNVVTRSGTNWHRGNLYGYFRDDLLTAENPLSGTKLPLDQQQIGGSAGGPILPRPHVLLHEPRVAQPRSVGSHDDRTGERSGDQRAADGDRLPGRRRSDRRLPESRGQHHVPGEGRSPGRSSQPHERPVFVVRRGIAQCARRRWTERTQCGLRARQPRPGHRDVQHVDAVVANGQRNASAGRARRSRGPTR